MTSRSRVLALVLAAVALVATALAITRRTEPRSATQPDAARPSFVHAFTPGRRLTFGYDWWVQTNKAACPGGYSNGPSNFYIAK
jgi:hypothetical protein